MNAVSDLLSRAKRQLHIIALRFTIGTLALGAWAFWRFAAWRSQLQNQLANLEGANHERP